jgi:hypothetical protein
MIRQRLRGIFLLELLQDWQKLQKAPCNKSKSLSLKFPKHHAKKSKLTRPPMKPQNRNRILLLGKQPHKMNMDPIHISHEMRKLIDPIFGSSPTP